MKEGKMLEKYMNLSREPKRLWNIKVKEIPIVVDAFGIFSKNLDKN